MWQAAPPRTKSFIRLMTASGMRWELSFMYDDDRYAGLRTRLGQTTPLYMQTVFLPVGSKLRNSALVLAPES